MSEPIRIGLIGVGRAGWGMHVPELAGRRDKYIYVAACDILEERRQKMADRFGCKVYSDWHELINDKDVELVCIATRSIDHFPMAVAAAKAGKTVMVEKPMCITYAQALQLAEIDADPSMPRIFPRFNRRFENHFMTIREVIDSGKLGEVQNVYITRNGFDRRTDWQTLREYGGGTLLNWGPHIVDQSLRLLGSPVKEQYSDIRHTVAAGNAEDHVDITFVGENGRTVNMQICGDMVFPTPEYRVYGTRGAIISDGDVLRLRYIDPEQLLPDPEADPGTPGQTFGVSGTFKSEEPIRWLDETLPCRVGDLTVIWDYMYNAIRNGESYPITMDEAVGVIKAIDDAKTGTEFKQ